MVTGMRATRFLLLLATLIVLMAAWRLWRSPWSAGNLEIVPDSVEYAVAADRVATHQGYNLLVDGVVRPPRYPPWFSVGLLAPVLFFAHGELGAAILPVFVLGLACVVTAFAVGDRLAGAWGAVGAATALLVNPAFGALAQLVMTEVPALAFGLFACWLFLDPEVPRSKRDALLAGIAGGAAFALRSESLAVLLPFAWRIVRRDRRPWTALALLGLPALAVAAGTAGYNAATFGSVRRAGYHYWSPEAFDVPGMVLGLRFVPQNLERLFTTPRTAVLLVGAAGAAVLYATHRDAARRVLLFGALAALPGTLLHMIYFYPEARFHIFVLALASIFGGAAAGSLAGRALGGRLWPLLFVVALAAFVPPRDPLPPPNRRLVAETIAKETPQDAVIVSGLDPVFLEPYVLRGTSRTVVPASRSVEYASKHVAPLKGQSIDPCPVVATESPGRLVQWIGEGRPVFVDASFLPADARPDRMLDRSLFVVRNPRFPWLGELRLRDRGEVSR
jgi:4-amino-4-deoxy-L-arabinose transferase-like glycosyltransferase